MGKYCIKEDYIHRELNATVDRDGQCFWTPDRLHMSEVLQWYEYDWARTLALTFGVKTLLDIGCGPAIKLNGLIAPVVERYVGIDQLSAVEYARARFSSGEYIAIDLDRLADYEGEPPLSQQYDFVICAAVIEHLNDPDQLLEFIARRVRPTGHILLSTCDRDRVRGIHCQMSPKPVHVREWNVHEFLDYVRQSGFGVCKIMHFLPGKMTEDAFWKEQNKMTALGDGRCLFHEMAFLLQVEAMGGNTGERTLAAKELSAPM